MFSFQASSHSEGGKALGSANAAGSPTTQMYHTTKTQHKAQTVSDEVQRSSGQPVNPQNQLQEVILSNPQLLQLYEQHQQAYNVYLSHLTQVIKQKQEQGPLAPGVCTFAPGVATESREKVSKYRSKRQKRKTPDSPSMEPAMVSKPNPEHTFKHGLMLEELKEKLYSREIECQKLHERLHAKETELTTLREQLNAKNMISYFQDQSSHSYSSDTASMSSPNDEMHPEFLAEPSSEYYEYEQPNVAPKPSPLTLQEKLKKLGGPPSDVYQPYWPGFNPHPAFSLKEDWFSMPLNQIDPSVVVQERKLAEEAEQRHYAEASLRKSHTPSPQPNLYVEPVYSSVDPSHSWMPQDQIDYKPDLCSGDMYSDFAGPLSDPRDYDAYFHSEVPEVSFDEPSSCTETEPVQTPTSPAHSFGSPALSDGPMWLKNHLKMIQRTVQPSARHNQM